MKPALETTFFIPLMHDRTQVRSSVFSVSAPSISRGHSILTGSEYADPAEPPGVLIDEISGEECVHGLSKMSCATWRISSIALMTSVVRGRSWND